jgi:NAD(P)-dependent dehydrogenase (short-subunit alcohol dehydrogenase family)
MAMQRLIRAVPNLLHLVRIAEHLSINKAAAVRPSLVDFDEGKLKRAAAGLDPSRVITVAADVAKTDQVKAYVGRTVATWGKIDVLFSNAGNDGPIVPTIEHPEEILDWIIATPRALLFLGCKYVTPQMNDGGSIVITSSITGVKGVAGDFFDQMIPLGRHGKPEEIARAVLFLAFDHSAYTSGSALMLGGGLCA